MPYIRQPVSFFVSVSYIATPRTFVPSYIYNTAAHRSYFKAAIIQDSWQRYFQTCSHDRRFSIDLDTALCRKKGDAFQVTRKSDAFQLIQGGFVAVLLVL